MTYVEIIDGIKPGDKDAMRKAQARMDSLIKPLGSLGKLESMAVRLAGITGKVHNRADKRCTVVMCADNGICEEGVSGSPQDITKIQTVNMTKGLCGMGVLSRHVHSEIKVVDIGVLEDCQCEGVIDRHVRRSTANFAKGPAMTRKEAEQAIEVGIDMVRQLAEEGVEVIGTGEMGIGNTSSTSACLMALTGLSPEETVGKGGGLTDEALENKKRVLIRALEVNKPDPGDPVDVLYKVGGLDIAGLVGCFLGGAYYRKPVLIDGVISALSALIAVRLCPHVKDYIFATHRSKEPSYTYIVKEIGLEPILDLDMRLGEGTGCAVAFPILSASCAIMNEMASFNDISYDESYRIDIREEEATKG